jgi:hypothetical protein
MKVIMEMNSIIMDSHESDSGNEQHLDWYCY